MPARGSRAWPYRVLTDSLVKTSSWAIDPDQETERDLPAGLPEWDYQTDLRLRRRLSIDPAACRQAVGLAEGSAIAISVRWKATPSLLRGSAAWVPLRDDTHDHVIDVELVGERLGGVLDIETMVVLAAQGDSRPAVAHRPGSCLWSDTVSVRLQGNAPLFPTALIPFSKAGLPHRAAWFLELGSDLQASALGAIQLLMNQEHPTVAAAVTRAGSPTDVDRAVLSALRSDVVRIMVERALRDDAFHMSDVFDKESLGAVLQGLIRTYMSSHLDEDLREIRRIHDNDPSLCATIIQAATDLLGDTR